MAASVRETLQRPHWHLISRLGYNQLFAFETDVLIVALHNILSWEVREARPTSVCRHLGEGQADEVHGPSVREKNPMYVAQAGGLAFSQSGSSRKQMAEWTSMYKRLIEEDVCEE